MVTDQANSLAAVLNCTTLQCLQQAEASVVLKALPSASLGIGASGDGVTWVPQVTAPYVDFLHGSFNKVPVILGSNRDEGTLFAAVGGPENESEYQMALEAQFGADAQAVLAQYPAASFASASAAAATVFGDAVFVSDARRTARALVAAGVKVWRYSFERAPEFVPYQGLGAHHAAEIRFVFGSTFLGNALTPSEEELGKTMRGHWVAMAREGKPGSEWPAYDAATDPYLEFAAGASAKMGLRTAESDFWDSLKK
jgi:para-nitrobenzyl esterase